MKETIIKSPCKINLFLDITGKREDGYHFIESLFHTVNLYDEIYIKESNIYSIKTEGKYRLDDNNENNICTKVFNFFKNYLNLEKNYSIRIIKNIPFGAGLGGGSSNASSIIKFLLEESKTNLNKKLNNIYELSSKFGADVPFFIRGGLSWASGIGEEIYNYPFVLPYRVILIYPNIHVSTKEAYSNFKSETFNKSDIEGIKKILENKKIDFKKFEKLLYNIFEENVFNLKPEIKKYKTTIENIVKRQTHMSGSGSSLFILYDKNENIDMDYDSIEKSLGNLFEIYKLDLI